MKLFRRNSGSQAPRRRQANATPDIEFDLSNRYLRNRTLAKPGPAAEEPSARTKVHALAARRRRAGAILALIVGASIILLLLLGELTAQADLGVGSDITKPIDSPTYINTINKYLDDHPVERLRFALNTTQLSAYVSSVDPEVASVTEANTWSIGPTHFTIQLRQPVAGWQIQGQQYYVDQQGIAFSKNYFADPGVQIVDQSGASLQANTAVTSSRFLSFIGKLVSSAKGRGYTVVQVVLPTGTTREVVIHVAGISYEFRLSIDRGPAEQTEDMDRVIKYLTGKGIAPSYVDLRVAGRAFYK